MLSSYNNFGKRYNAVDSWLISMTCLKFSIICSLIIFYWLIKNVFAINHCNLFDKHYFQTIKQRIFTPWKLRSIKLPKHWFCVSIGTLDWYLFQLIVFLKLDFYWCNSSKFSKFDKVIAATSVFFISYYIFDTWLSIPRDIWMQSSEKVKKIGFTIDNQHLKSFLKIT